MVLRDLRDMARLEARLPFVLQKTGFGESTWVRCCHRLGSFRKISTAAVDVLRKERSRWTHLSEVGGHSYSMSFWRTNGSRASSLAMSRRSRNIMPSFTASGMFARRRFSPTPTSASCVPF